jgi:hypothetical protein
METTRDRSAWRDFAILARVPVIGGDDVNFFCARALESIDHHEKFHQCVVHWATSTLDDVDVSSANVFANLYKEFAIAESANIGGAQGLPELLADLLSQGAIGIPR